MAPGDTNVCIGPVTE